MRKSIIRRLVRAVYHAMDAIEARFQALKVRTIPLQKKIIESKDFLKDELKLTYTQTRQATHYVYHSDLIQNRLYHFLIEALQGYFYPVDTSNTKAIWESRKTRYLLIQFAVSNSYFFGMAMLYQIILDNVGSDENTEAGTSEKMLNALAIFYLARLGVQNFIDVIAQNACIAKSAANENQNHRSIENGEQNLSYLRASMASAFYYVGNIIPVAIGGLALAELEIPGGPYLELIGYALGYGYVFVEFKLANAKQSTEQRYRTLRTNNGFCFGLGMSFISAVSVNMYLLRSLFRIHSNYFMQRAVFDFHFQLYMFLASIMSKPLPGETEGLDFFKYNRLVTDAILNDVSDIAILKLGSRYTELKAEYGFEDIKENANVANSASIVNKDKSKKMKLYPPLKLLHFLFLNKNYLSMKKFVKIESISLFLNFYLKDIESGVEELEAVRKTWWKKLLAEYVIIPFPWPHNMVSPEDKKTYILAFNKNLSSVLIDIKARINKIKNIIVQATIYSPEKRLPALIENYYTPVELPKPCEILEFDFRDILENEQGNLLVESGEFLDLLPEQVLSVEVMEQNDRADEIKFVDEIPVEVAPVLKTTKTNPFQFTNFSIFENYQRDGMPDNEPSMPGGSYNPFQG